MIYVKASSDKLIFAPALERYFLPFSVKFLAENLQGSLFGPYTPLQQLDVLADYGTKSYIVGSTNSLLLQQKDRYSDILINVCIIFYQKTAH